MKRRGEERPEVLKKLAARHHEMARMMLLGWSNKEIGTALGVVPERVSAIRNSPIMQQHLGMLMTARDSRAVEVGVELARDAPKSLRLLQEIRDGEHGSDLKLRAQVARDLLDRAGHGKVQKVEGVMRHGHYIEGVLEKVKARRAVEAEFEVVTQQEDEE